MRCGNCQGDHGSASQVRACYAQRPTDDTISPSSDHQAARSARDEELVAEAQARSAPAATEKQVSYILSLVSEHDIDVLTGNLYERAFDLGTGAEKFISKTEASDLISALKEAPKVSGNGNGNGNGNLEDLQGVHMLDGQYVKVQLAIHGSGKPYAKTFDEGSATWSYAGRAPLYRLSEETRLTAEQAARFGELYGQCVFCGLGLTDERSIEVGYGPVCAENNGLPWGGGEK